jgi:putative transposase
VDVHKQVKGRKRHLVVDTLGLVLTVLVHSAGIQDAAGAKLVLSRLAQLKERFPRLQLIWADGAYASVVEWTCALAGWVLQIVKRPDAAKGFVPLPRRWVVERTIAWLKKYGRLVRDYEETTQSSEAWVRVAMIHVMAHRSAP